MLRSFDRVLAWLTWLVAAFAVAALLIGPELVGAKNTGPPKGPAVYSAGGCGACHTLAATQTVGTAGPNLDELQPDAATVRAAVSQGTGSMPSFEGRLTAAEIRAVAEFVASSAGR
jgi:mono/diheme cytochrome c family protein